MPHDNGHGARTAILHDKEEVGRFAWRWRCPVGDRECMTQCAASLFRQDRARVTRCYAQSLGSQARRWSCSFFFGIFQPRCLGGGHTSLKCDNKCIKAKGQPAGMGDEGNSCGPLQQLGH